ncbi:MAG: hypothetical protein WCP23_09865 [Planctomycetota bacterium]
MEGMTILGSLIAKSCSRWRWTGIFSKLQPTHHAPTVEGFCL